MTYSAAFAVARGGSCFERLYNKYTFVNFLM